MVMAESDTQEDTTSTSYVDSNLSATITPKFATSKILILVMNTVQQQGYIFIVVPLVERFMEV